MEQYIPKSVLVAEIKRRIEEITQTISLGDKKIQKSGGNRRAELVRLLSSLGTLEVKEGDFIAIPYNVSIQYTDRESAIKAHAEDYSWNIESELFQQLTPEQQKLWRKEIEQACISGGYCGLNLQKDSRYDDNLEVKEVGLDKEINTWHLQEKEDIYDAIKDWGLYKFACIMKDGTIQKFTGNLDEDSEGHIHVHIDGVNDDYDNVDDIVKWIEYT